MVSKLTIIPLLLFTLALFLSNGANAQSSCTKTLMALSPCLNYVTGNSSSPSSSCCSQLSNVVTSQPQCLCLLVNGTTSSYGLNINQTLALELPKACSVETPPTSRCNAANAPSASPDNQKTSPATTTTIPSGSKTTAPQNGSSNVGAPYGVVLLLLFIASHVATF